MYGGASLFIGVFFCCRIHRAVLAKWKLFRASTRLHLSKSGSPFFFYQCAHSLMQRVSSIHISQSMYYFFTFTESSSSPSLPLIWLFGTSFQAIRFIFFSLSRLLRTQSMFSSCNLGYLLVSSTSFLYQYCCLFYPYLFKFSSLPLWNHLSKTISF